MYKVQGKTLDKAVVYLDNYEMHSGSDLVAVSRVRRLEDLAFEDKHISFDRLRNIGKTIRASMTDRFEEEARLLELAELQN